MNLKSILAGGLLAVALLSSGAEKWPGIDLRQFSTRSREPGLSVRVFPMAYLDNLFCVLEGMEQPIAFSFMDRAPKKAKKPLIFKVTTPKGFSLNVEYRYMRLISHKKLSNGDVESTYEVKVPHYTANLTPWGCAFGQISSSLKPDGKRYKLQYSVKSADGQGGSFTTDLMVIPFETAPQPKLFKSGMVFCGLWPTSLDAKRAVRGAELLKKTGFNIMSTDYRNKTPFISELKKAGVTRCWGWREFLGDGYLMGYGPKPENAKFRDADNKWLGRGICPEEAVTQGPYYRKHFLSELERMMYKEDYGEHYMANWEPIIFSKRGCFCPRCKAAFLKFSKLPEGEVNKVWPKGILKKYKKEWQHFRATQHARIMRNIQSALTSLDKKYGRKQPSMFLPEIACANLLEGNEKYLGDFYTEYDARYYEKDLPGLEPWGPYLMHDFLGAYRAVPGRHLTMTYLAAEIIKQLKERNNGRRAQLFAFPHGIQCGSWVTTPQAMSFETLAFFVCGWEGSLLYSFPDGYDGRYWNVVSRANKLIAAHEGFVRNGKPFSGMEVKAVSPYPHGVGIDNYSTSGKYFTKELRSGSMLRGFGFQSGKNYCIAIANAWERGRVIASLKIPGLPAGNYSVKASDSQKTFRAFTSSRALASGIQLEVPALDWLFVTLEPSRKGGTIAPVKMTKAETELLKKHAHNDTELLKSSFHIPEYRFDETPFISNGPVTIRPKRNCKVANSILQVTAPGYRGELLMASGGIFSHIKPKGLTLKNGSFFGGDGVWGEFTGSTNQQPFFFEKWSADGDEITVVLKAKLNILAGLMMEKTYRFGPQKARVQVRITNSDDVPFNLNYRLRSYWRMMAPADVRCGKDILAQEEKSLFLLTSASSKSRPFRKAKVQNGFGVSKVMGIAKGRKEKAVLVDYLNDQCGIYFWRSKDGSEFTAEKIFDSVRLQPGKSVTFSSEISFPEGK